MVKGSSFYRKYRSHTAHFERDFLGGFGRMVKRNRRVYPPGLRKNWRKRDTQQTPARALARGIDSTSIAKRRLSIRLYQTTLKGGSFFFAPLATTSHLLESMGTLGGWAMYLYGRLAGWDVVTAEKASQYAYITPLIYPFCLFISLSRLSYLSRDL
jgi:hypothetical protein